MARRTARRPEGNGPQPFAFGKAPEPQRDLEPESKPKRTGLATHTGTDPYGRAIGPAEDHTEAKLDADGKTARGPAGAASRPDQPADELPGQVTEGWNEDAPKFEQRERPELELDKEEGNAE